MHSDAVLNAPNCAVLSQDNLAMRCMPSQRMLHYQLAPGPEATREPSAAKDIMCSGRGHTWIFRDSMTSSMVIPRR